MADIPLVEKMRLHVQAFPGLDTAPEMTRLANELEASIKALVSAEQSGLAETRRTLGCWARARRLWCNVTGEPLV